MTRKKKIKEADNTRKPGKKSAKNERGIMPIAGWICIAVIALITYFTFSPSMNNEFTNWDDDVYVLNNPLVVNNGVPLKEIFQTPVSANYHPITMLTLAWNYQGGRSNPRGYHLWNVLIHIMNTILVFFFIFLLTRRNLLMAGIVALFFGIHPMHVESVSWVSERKDVLYVFFLLCGLITYLQYRQSRKISWYIFTLLLFILSCLSKGMAVVFPILLLLIDYLENTKWERKVLIEKIPFFVLALGFGILAFKTQLGVAISDEQTFTIPQRFMFASYGAIMYIAKLFVPINLSSYYPYPAIGHGGIAPIFYLSPLILASLIALVYFFLRKEKAIVFGLLFYFVSVVLVLQFISVGMVIMAERYSYLSYIGLLFAVAYIINKAWEAKEGIGASLKYPLLVITFISAVCFSYVAYGRTQVWKNSETLWTDVIKKIGNSYQVYTAYVNRGDYYYGVPQNDKALHDYNMALKFNDKCVLAYNNRGNIYRDAGHYDLALADYNKDIAMEPGNYLPYANRAVVYVITKKYDLGMNDLTKSISLNPGYWFNYLTRGYYYYDIGQDDKAITDFTEGIRLNLEKADIYYMRGLAYTRKKKYNDAYNDFTTAINLNPKSANYYINRSSVNKAMGRNEEAREDALKAKQLGGS